MSADAGRGPGTVEVAFDAVVLAGGTARRLDGVSKPDVEVGGRRLLDHALAATTGARRVVVVAPESVRVPPGVLRTLEDPPHGGPAAGIAAGLAALDAAGGAPDPAGAVTQPPETGAPWVLVLACDVPFAASAVPRLLDTATSAPGPATGRSTGTAGDAADGACLRDASGYLQWLVGVYRGDALRASLAALGPRSRGASVRALLAPLTVASVAAAGDEALDVDTWADLDALDH